MRFLVRQIVSLLSNLELLQCGILMVPASTLGHLYEMKNMGRYVICGFGCKKPMSGRKFVHLEEEIVNEVSRT